MRFAVIDVETTGFGRSDRVVEVSVVTLDDLFRPIEEFDSLINPGRDVGPTSIHGITATMVSSAPTFEDIAGVLAGQLTDAVLVAHNLPFDVRMLRQEFDRVGGMLIPGIGFDTLGPTGCALDVACEALRIPLHHHHRALADARATAELIRALWEADDELTPAVALYPPSAKTVRTLRREAVAETTLPLPRLRPPQRYPTGDERALSYLHALNWMLDDAVIDETERQQLNELAEDLGLDPVHLTQLHSHYLRHLVDAVTGDGVVTTEERALLERVATALGVDSAFLPERSPLGPVVGELAAGSRVCFTGDATHWSRSELEAAAALAGFQPVSSVTRRACDLVVAADPASQSGKAGKARQYGIPIVALTAFVTRIGLGLP